jgi:hypothetical protein
MERVPRAADKRHFNHGIRRQDERVLVRPELRAVEAVRERHKNHHINALVREAVGEDVKECRDRGRLVLDVVDRLAACGGGRERE